MPNWTFNAMTVRGDKKSLRTFKKKFAGKNGAVDFNSLVPMPKSLDITSGSDTLLGMACWDKQRFDDRASLTWFAERYPGVTTPEQLRAIVEPDVVELGKQALDNIEQYGVPTWYEWSHKNWGTKWNACEVELTDLGDSLEYQFDTAWDAPRELVEPIIELAHQLGLSVVWDAEHEGEGNETIYNDDREAAKVA